MHAWACGDEILSYLLISTSLSEVSAGLMPPMGTSRPVALTLLLLLQVGRGLLGAGTVAAPRAVVARSRHAPVSLTTTLRRGSGAGKAAGASSEFLLGEDCMQERPLRVMIAGGGIGGLCAALVLKNQGYDVSVFEKAVAYKPFGGPIQIATNALESIRRIDADAYEQIMASSTKIGDRVNGLKDGISNEWFATFDLLSPAKSRNQEASVVIDRPTLQDILLSKVGDCVRVGIEVVGYEKQSHDADAVVGILADGTRHEADMLIGSDGIWSKVRRRDATSRPRC